MQTSQHSFEADVNARAAAALARGDRPPIAGGAAPGSPAPPPPAPAQPPAAPPQAAPAAPAAATSDPWQSALEGIDPGYRPMVEQAFGAVRPHVQQQLDRFQPLGQYADLLTELVNDVDPQSGGNALAGLLDFYAMTGDESRVDQFYDWWEAVGQRYDFFADEGGEPGAGGDPSHGDPGGDPAADAPPWAQQIMEQQQQLQQRLDQGEAASATEREAQQLREQLDGLMQQHGIVDDPNTPEDQRPSRTIARLAMSYANEQNAIELAVRDYLSLIGQGQQQLINGAGGGMPPTPQPTLSGDGGGPGVETPPVTSWGDARKMALSRLQAAQAAGG